MSGIGAVFSSQPNRQPLGSRYSSLCHSGPFNFSSIFCATDSSSFQDRFRGKGTIDVGVPTQSGLIEEVEGKVMRILVSWFTNWPAIKFHICSCYHELIFEHAGGWVSWQMVVKLTDDLISVLWLYFLIPAGSNKSPVVS